MPGEVAKAETNFERRTPDGDDSRTLGAPVIKRSATLVPVHTEPLTDEQRFPSQHEFYGD